MCVPALGSTIPVSARLGHPATDFPFSSWTAAAHPASLRGMTKQVKVPACRERGCYKPAQVKGRCWMHHKRLERAKHKDRKTA